MKTLLVLLLAACGASTPPAQPPTTASGQVSCPDDLATLAGHPCRTDGQSCGEASSTGFSNAMVCKAGTWQQVEVPPPPPPGGLACGTTSCKPDQICIATNASGGAAPPPGGVTSSTSYACSTTPQPVGSNPGVHTCGEVKDRRQSCSEMRPVAAPHR